MDAFASVLFGRALAIAVRAGLFEVLRDHALLSSEIAGAIGLHPEGVSLLVKSFVEGGYLKRIGSTYALTRQGRKWLLIDSPQSMVKLIGYFEMLYGRWGSLEDTLRAGEPASPYYQNFDEHDWEMYVFGMRDLARFLVPELKRKVTLPRRAAHLLDVGGSHGLYAIDCCQRSSLLTATVVDFEEPLRWTRQFIREAGLEGRVNTMAGNFLTLDLPEKQDIILLFNVIHGLREEQNRELIGRLLGTLASGGRMYVLDQMIASAGQSQLARLIPLMVGLNLLNEIGGKAYEVDDIRRWCGAAQRVRRLKLRIPGLTLVEVVK